MNLLEKIPFLKDDKKSDAEAELTEEEAKAERIKFHRTSVRNGPVKYRPQTNGQVRRFAHRELARKTKRARRAQVSEHFAQKREIAVLRSHLQAVGIIQYAGQHTPAPGTVVNAVTWIIARFADDSLADERGRVTITEVVVRSSLQAALNRYQHLTNRPITGLSDTYVLPVGVAA